MGREIFFEFQASHGRRGEKNVSDIISNQQLKPSVMGGSQAPPKWNIVSSKREEETQLHSPQTQTVESHPREVECPESFMNEPGLMYVSSEERLGGSIRGHQHHGHASTGLMDTLAYSVDTLPLPPGSGSAVTAGDAFPIAPPPTENRSVQPPGVSVLRGLNSDSSKPKSAVSSSKSLRSVITGGGMTMVNRDLFKQNMENMGFSDADAGYAVESHSVRSEHQDSHERMGHKQPSARGYPKNEEDQPNNVHASDPSPAPTVPSIREQLIRERGKQHARNMWKEKHQNPALEGSQSARSERKNPDDYDDNSTVVTAHSHYTHKSAFPSAPDQHPETPVEEDSRAAQRNKKKGDLIEISFADNSGGSSSASSRKGAGKETMADREEERRRAKFEMMKRKKMEEAEEREKVGDASALYLNMTLNIITLYFR